MNEDLPFEASVARSDPAGCVSDSLGSNNWTVIIIIIIIIIITALEFSLSGSSPYTSTDKTNKNKHT